MIEMERCRDVHQVVAGKVVLWAVLHVHQSQPCTPPTMKRVADSQLTKDTDDGDDGPEVTALWSMRYYPKFISPHSHRKLVSDSRRPQTPNS